MTWRSSTTWSCCARWRPSSARSSPAIVLTHSPQDYMEDHMNTSPAGGDGGVHARDAELQDRAAPPDGGLRRDGLSRDAARPVRSVCGGASCPAPS